MFPTCSKQHVYGYIVSNKSLCLLYYSSVADLLPIPNALKLSWTLLSVKLSESCHDRNMLIFFWSPLLFLALSLFSLSITPPPSLSLFLLSLSRSHSFTLSCYLVPHLSLIILAWINASFYVKRERLAQRTATGSGKQGSEKSTDWGTDFRSTVHIPY